MVILDTNVIIDHLRQSPERSILLKIIEDHPEETFAVSLVSIQELNEGKSTRNEDKEKYLLSTLAQLELIPYTYEVAKLAGQIARDHIYPIDLADAAIAATTILNGASLCTLNTRDFKGIKELEFYSS